MNGMRNHNDHMRYSDIYIDSLIDCVPSNINDFDKQINENVPEPIRLAMRIM